MFWVVRWLRLLIPYLSLWVKIRCKFLRLLLVAKLIPFTFFVFVLILLVSSVEAWSHWATTDLMIEKFFSMLIVVCDIKNLCRVIILHAETVAIIIIHWVVKGIKIVLTHYLWLLLLLFGLLLLVIILSISSCHTRPARSAPEISVNLLGHLIATRGCSPSSASHYSSLKVEVAWHQCI